MTDVIAHTYQDLHPDLGAGDYVYLPQETPPPGSDVYQTYTRINLQDTNNGGQNSPLTLGDDYGQAGHFIFREADGSSALGNFAFVGRGFSVEVKGGHDPLGYDYLEGGVNFGNTAELYGYEGYNDFVASQGADHMHGSNSAVAGSVGFVGVGGNDVADYYKSNGIDQWGNFVGGIQIYLDGSTPPAGPYAMGDTFENIDDVVATRFGDQLHVGSAAGLHQLQGDPRVYYQEVKAGRFTQDQSDDFRANQYWGPTYQPYHNDPAEYYTNYLLGFGQDIVYTGLGTSNLDYEAAGGVVVDLMGPGLNSGYAATDQYLDSNGYWISTTLPVDLVGSPYGDVLRGNDADNNIKGDPGAPLYDYTGGSDYIEGRGGNDFISGGPGGDYIDGGSGNNTLSFADARAGVYASLNPSDWSSMWGEAAGDTYYNMQNMYGSSYSDVLKGDSADNKLLGGWGADALTGGGGADQFIYISQLDSPVSNPDIITDFEVGLDKIELRALHVGQQNVGIAYNGNASYVFVDTDQNGSGDLLIEVIGNGPVGFSDFIF